MTNLQKLKTEQELEKLQHDAFHYFLHEANPKNGLVADKTAVNWPASIAATGVGLTSYVVAVERGYMTRAAAVERTLTTLRFFWNSPQSTAPNATGYKGFYYHFLDMKTGQRAWQCELSTVDSAFLLVGMLACAMYFNSDSHDEREIRTLADLLYRRVDWKWAQNNGPILTHGWKPETDFLPFRWEGYDEALLLYMLALGSPTHPIQPESYTAWGTTYEWKNYYDYDFLYTGPLFTHQLSHIWIDFRGIQDAFMRDKKMDYFENSRRATYVQQQYAIENPMKFVGYSDCCWGITASDGPGPATLIINGVERTFYDYIARGVPYGPDDGTIAPWATIASLPFAPEIVLPVIDHYIYRLNLREGHRYGFKATFNLTYPCNEHHTCGGWVSPYHFGINQGPITLMTENFRTGLLWKLMRNCSYIVNGLRKAGFTGGWLDLTPLRKHHYGK